MIEAIGKKLGQKTPCKFKIENELTLINGEPRI